MPSNNEGTGSLTFRALSHKIAANLSAVMINDPQPSTYTGTRSPSSNSNAASFHDPIRLDNHSSLRFHRHLSEQVVSHPRMHNVYWTDLLNRFRRVPNVDPHFLPL